MVAKLKPYSKAIAGALAGALATAVPLASGGFSLPEILSIALAALGGAGVVYAAPKNTEKPDILGKA